ncbi:MAG: carbohydrate ABC transporter permease [Aestuariivirga sp.]
MMSRRWPIVALLYVAVLLVPLAWLVSLSFKSEVEIVQKFTIWPANPVFDNFLLIFTVSSWWMGYVHAGIYVVMNVLISLIVALPAAYAFSRSEFRLKKPLFVGLLFFRLLAPIIMVVPFTEIFYDIGLFDTHIAVALAHCYFNVPIAIWILEGAISAIPPEMDQSANIDGHSLFSFLGRVLIPTIAPTIAVAAFFCFVFSWVEYVLSGALTAVDAKPISGIMMRVASVSEGDYGVLAAVSLVGFVPGIIFFLLIRRHLLQGFAIGRAS